MFPLGFQTSVNTFATSKPASGTPMHTAKETYHLGASSFRLKEKTSHVIFSAQSEATETNGQHIVQR